MPIFEFHCNACGKKFELLIRTSGDELICPACGSRDLRKLISSFAFSSKNQSGETTVSGSGCSGCSGGNCSSCHG